MTARKPRLREAAIATTRFFMETKVATKPFLVANTTARKTRLKEALIEAINLAKPVIREIKNFLIEVRIFEKNAVMEVRIVKIPVLIEPRSFLMAVNSIRGKENDAREGPAATTTPSGFKLASGRRMEVSLITGTTPSLSPGSACSGFLSPLPSLDFR